MDEHLKVLFTDFQEQFSVGRGSNLQDVEGVTSVTLEALFKNSAALWRASPWNRFRSRHLLGVKVGAKADWHPLEHQPFSCVRFSSSVGGVCRLDLLRSAKDAFGSNGYPTKAIPIGGLLRISFGNESGLAPEVRKMIRTLRLEIAKPEAYPGFEVLYPPTGEGLVYGHSSISRSPNLTELRWAAACMEAIAVVTNSLVRVEIPSRFYTFEDFRRTLEVALPETANGRLEMTDKQTVPVKITFPPKVTVEAVPKLDNADEDPTSYALNSFCQCGCCSRQLRPHRCSRCSICRSVFYCGPVCQRKDWKEIHKDDCQKRKRLMDRAVALRIDLFSFPVMDFEQPCGWLDQLGLHSKGMWRRLCNCKDKSCPYGFLPTLGTNLHATAWGLETGHYPTASRLVGSVRKFSSSPESGGPSGASPANSAAPRNTTPARALDASSSSSGASKSQPSASEDFEAEAHGSSKSDPKSCNGEQVLISSWQDYYQLRTLPFSSPAAALLTYPLTVYHIAANVCPSTRRMLADGKEVIIHYLNPQGELDWQPAFAEISHLLLAGHGGSFNIVMIGAEVPTALSGEIVVLGNCKRLRMTFVEGVYNEEIISLHPPNLTVALNAGLDRFDHTTWAADLATIKKQAVPTFFTDYAESSCLSSLEVLRAAELPLTVPITPNPFRSPVRCQLPFNAIPCYVNAFLFGV